MFGIYFSIYFSIIYTYSNSVIRFVMVALATRLPLVPSEREPLSQLRAEWLGRYVCACTCMQMRANESDRLGRHSQSHFYWRQSQSSSVIDRGRVEPWGLNYYVWSLSRSGSSTQNTFFSLSKFILSNFNPF